MLSTAPIPMLANPATRLPVGSAWRYEPKLDGFRGLLGRDRGSHVFLTSRNGKDLVRWFPELAQAGNALPAGTTLDGEIVIADEEGIPNFGALQHRLTLSARQPPRLSSSSPAILVVFDLLALAGCELLGEPLAERRQQLELLLKDLHPCLQLVEQTASLELARDWLASAPALEGVVASELMDGIAQAIAVG